MLKELNVEDIIVQDRAREVDVDSPEFEDLVQSIQQFGLLTPITVRIENKKHILVGGARRLKACEMLGISSIPCNVIEATSSIAASAMELEENIRRKKFTWVEKALAVGQLFYAATAADHNLDQNKFSEWIMQSPSMTSIELAIYDARLDYPDILMKDTIEQAFKELRRRQADELLAEKLERDNAVSVEEGVTAVTGDDNVSPVRIYGSAQELLSSLPNDAVDCICTDPPFGIDLTTHSGKDGVYDFDDTKENYEDLMHRVIPEFARVLKEGAHLYMFIDIKSYQYIVDELEQAGFGVNKVPIIWHRVGAGALAIQPMYYPASAYQACIQAFAPGERRTLVVQGRTNLLDHEVVPTKDKQHGAEIPVSVYRDLLSRSVVKGDVIIDPFCGVGNCLVAGIELGCEVAGADINSMYARIAADKISTILKGDV